MSQSDMLMFCQDLSLKEVELSAPHPTLNLEDQGIPSSLPFSCLAWAALPVATLLLA